MASSSGRTRILVVRHGETDCNVQGIIQGQLDTDLNDVGRQQAKLVGKALAVEHIDEVYSSPLRRARDTADAIVGQHPRFRGESGNGAYWLDDRLKERGFGVLEGKQLDRSKPRRDSTRGIEQMGEFTTRLASFLADVLLRPAPWASEQPRSNGHGNTLHMNGHTTKSITRPATIPIDTTTASITPDTPAQQLNTGGCERTILLVAHGAAISALVGAVLLDSGLASLGSGIARSRVWNCSITEIVFDMGNAGEVPQLTTQGGQQRTDLVTLIEQSSQHKSFVIERWADVRHLPASLDDAVAETGAADEMVAKQNS